jgi:hypothetical protein
MKVENKRFNDFKEFFHEVIFNNNEIVNPEYRFIFRGESSNRFQLLPSALRLENKRKNAMHYADRLSDGSFVSLDDLEKSQVESEYRLLKDFYVIADRNGLTLPNVEIIRRNIVNNPLNSREHLVRMTTMEDKNNQKWLSYDLAELAGLAQHYGIKTRMLDWTFDIFVALYFAVDGICLHKKENDTVSNENIVIWALNSFYLNNLKLPLKFVVPPYSGNANLNAQKGILTYWEIEIDHTWTLLTNGAAYNNSRPTDRTPLDNLLKDFPLLTDNQDDFVNNPIVLYKFEIPIRDCKEIKDFLKKIGYSKSRLLPGFSSVAQEVYERNR